MRPGCTEEDARAWSDLSDAEDAGRHARERDDHPDLTSAEAFRRETQWQADRARGQAAAEHAAGKAKATATAARAAAIHAWK